MKTLFLILVLSFISFGQTVQSIKTPKPKAPSNKPEIVSQASDAPHSSNYKGKAKEIIISAEILYQKGLNYLYAKSSTLARAAFDDAISLLLNANVADDEQPQIAEYYEKLQDSIYELEFEKKPPPQSVAESSQRKSVAGQSPKSGQGFNEQVFNPGNDELARSLPSDAQILGSKPIQGKDGKVSLVMKYFDEYFNDPCSIRFVRWSTISKVYLNNEPYWSIQVKFRARNAFNAYILSEMLFYSKIRGSSPAIV